MTEKQSRLRGFERQSMYLTNKKGYPYWDSLFLSYSKNIISVLLVLVDEEVFPSKLFLKV